MCEVIFYKQVQSLDHILYKKDERMNKLHTALLTAILCSMVHGLTASERRQLVFSDQQTNDSFKMAGKIYAGLYGATWGLWNVENIWQICSTNNQSLIHRNFKYIPNDYQKYAEGSSRIGNIFKGNTIICRELLKSVPKTQFLAITAALMYAYQKNSSQE